MLAYVFRKTVPQLNDYIMRRMFDIDDFSVDIIHPIDRGLQRPDQLGIPGCTFRLNFPDSWMVMRHAVGG